MKKEEMKSQWVNEESVKCECNVAFIFKIQSHTKQIKLDFINTHQMQSKFELK